MKYTSKERLQIGQLVYTRQLLEAEACLKYGISRTCIQNYVRAFKKENGITIVTRRPQKHADRVDFSALQPKSSPYASMSKDELIDELIRTKAEVLRAKKGYAVKGDGASKAFITLRSENSK
ncbi:MAG: hypothetical protein ACFWTM_04615 [Mitsuokella multacida]|nr:MAG TPA: Protein of unknown function (DUF1804) [Caudoviricetes sp.]